MSGLTNMTANIAVIALVFLVGLVLGGAGIWLMGRRRTTADAPAAKSSTDLSFRLSYIALPGVVALTTVVAIVIMYPSLPTELAYRFSSSGEPRGLIGRELFIGLMIGAQFIVVGLAAAVAVAIINMARRMMKDYPVAAPGNTIWLMVNMVVLPQLIVAFVALDAAYYARTATHIMTPWLFSLLAIGVGTLAIIVLFARSFNETRKAK